MHMDNDMTDMMWRINLSLCYRLTADYVDEIQNVEMLNKTAAGNYSWLPCNLVFSISNVNLHGVCCQHVLFIEHSSLLDAPSLSKCPLL